MKIWYFLILGVNMCDIAGHLVCPCLQSICLRLKNILDWNSFCLQCLRAAKELLSDFLGAYSAYLGASCNFKSHPRITKLRIWRLKGLGCVFEGDSADMCVDGGQSEWFSLRNPWTRTPICASGIYDYFSFVSWVARTGLTGLIYLLWASHSVKILLAFTVYWTLQVQDWVVFFHLDHGMYRVCNVLY